MKMNHVLNLSFIACHMRIDSIVVGFWPLSRSQHVSRCVRSAPSNHRIPYAYRLNTDSRRKPRVLPWAYARPELPIWDINSQVSFGHNDPEPSIKILISNETVPLVEVPSLRDEDPLRRLPLLRWLQFSSTIPAIHKFSYAARSFSRSNCYNAPTST